MMLLSTDMLKSLPYCSVKEQTINSGIVIVHRNIQYYYGILYVMHSASCVDKYGDGHDQLIEKPTMCTSTCGNNCECPITMAVLVVFLLASKV